MCMESAPAKLTTVELVRCLGCGTEYVKPSGRRTLRANPGCPECTYVGWIPSGDRFRTPSLLARSGADPLPRPRQRSG
jgi:hypothetical protein